MRQLQNLELINISGGCTECGESKSAVVDPRMIEIVNRPLSAITYNEFLEVNFYLTQNSDDIREQLFPWLVDYNWEDAME